MENIETEKNQRVKQHNLSPLNFKINNNRIQ